MKQILFFLFIVLLMNVAMATDYYISNDGEDSNNGTSDFSPWKTLSKIYDVTINPGDTISLNRGDVWREALELDGYAGTPDSQITIDVYGSGSKPMITATNEVTGWSQHEGHIYKATVDLPGIYHVFVNGTYYNRSHHPNNDEYFRGDVSGQSYGVTSSDLDGLTESEIVGGVAYLWTANWAIETRNIISFDEETFTFNYTTQTSYTFDNNERFYLENKLWMLDSPGEWWFNSSSKEFFIWLQKNISPVTALVEVSARDKVGYFSNSENLIVKNISFMHSNRTGVSIVTSENVSIVDCNINYSQSYGISLSSSNNLLVKQNLISKNHNGISISSSEDSLITDNDISYTTMVGRARGRSTAALLVGSNDINNVVEYNNILNNGYIGIRIGGYNNSIRYNYINNSCSVLQDCGGIYTWLSSPDKNIRGTISNNIIENGNSYAFGIYLDDRTGYNKVYNNTILSHPIGINIHNSKNNSIKDNLIALNEDVSFSSNAMIRFDEDGNKPYTGFLSNTSVKHNIFFSEDNVKVLYQSTSGHFDFGFSDYNLFWIYNGITHRKTGSGFNDNYNLSEWVAYTGNESNSEFYSYEILPSNYFSRNKSVIIYNRFQSDKTFTLDNNYTDIKTGKKYLGSITLNPFESRVLVPLECNYDYHCNNNETIASCPHDCKANWCEAGTATKRIINAKSGCEITVSSNTDRMILLHDGQVGCDSDVTVNSITSVNGGLNLKSNCNLRLKP